jgi:oxalate decarboxylase/phosphoglucose isomerase-like protein (cupin superfamily)
VLDEGDLLYIPPHWFHRVTSMSALSFSVNSWWVSRSFGIASQVLEQPLPFQAE